MRWLQLAFLNVLRNGRRSMLTILITGIATLTILVSCGFALFTYQSLAEKAARDEGNITITDPRFYQEEEDLPMQHGLTQVDNLVDVVTADEAIKAALPRINFSGLTSNGEKTAIFLGLGVTAAEFRVKGPFLNMLEGQALSEESDTPQVVLAQGLARSMKVKVGDSVTLMATTTDGALNAFDFVVRGIYTTGVPDLDKRQLYVDLAQAQQLLNTDKVSSISLYLFDIDQTEAQLQTLQQLPALHHVLFTPWWERAFYYQSVKGLYNRIFGLLGVMMVLLVFFSISNTMGMTVTERTREIGTIAALGGYRFEILRNFMLEAGIIGLSGALLGTLLSYLTSHLLLQLGLQMPPPPGSSQGYPLTILFSWSLACASCVVLTLVCISAAFKASWNGCNKPITEALTHV